MILLIGGNGSLGYALIDNFRLNDETICCISRTRPTNLSAEMDWFECDIEKILNFENCLNEIFKKYPIKSVVQNAATTFPATNLSSLSDDQIFSMLNVNLIATAKVIQKLEDPYVVHEHTINYAYISSNSIRTLNASNPFYIATKAASESLVLNFAKRAGHRVKANIIRPGLMPSKLTEARFSDAEKKVVSLTPAGRLAPPKEVAKVVSNVLRDMPSTFHGQIVSIDGGRTI
tara:strand:- start:289 stop:984 length:696 start_codon:yes stop_codon:yes gene_type:complete